VSDSKVDPRLRLLLLQPDERHGEFFRSMQMGTAEQAASPDTVEVLVQIRRGQGTRTRASVRNRLTASQADCHTIVEGPSFVACARIPPGELPKLARQPWVEAIDSSRRFYPELDLSASEVELHPAHNIPPITRGAQVLVGIVDSGIDWRHDDFRHADGSSRILFLWDQRADGLPGARVPFGREYTKAQLDAVLANAAGAPTIGHTDQGGHGTHVTCIAAGNGRRSAGQFIGMAPDADLIVVVARGDGGSVGESASAIAATQYLVERAGALSRPIAINLSFGNNGGGHAGETPLETALDALARRPGVAIVKSAGNENGWRTHASATLVAGQTLKRRFDSFGSNQLQDVMEFWFDARDRIAVTVQPPGGLEPAPGDFAGSGETKHFRTPAGNVLAIIGAAVDAGGTGDVRGLITIDKGNQPRIQPGRWTLHVRGDAIEHGRFDVWIERTDRGTNVSEQSMFVAADADPECTISIPGTARRVITVGSYVTRLAGVVGTGGLSDFSSRGPTRYGLNKPDIAAPGQSICAALSAQAAARAPFLPGYTLDFGTSMSAPHVTGAAALMLEVNARLTCEQIRQLLQRTARRSGAAAAAPHDRWGAGRLSVRSAVEAARTARFPQILDVVVDGTTLHWRTDMPATAAVRFSRHRRRLSLGRPEGSRASLSVAQDHHFDLRDLPSGTYFCELLAFLPPPDQLHTLFDDDGRHVSVNVPAA
jgi:subtilisin family serine protease